MKKYVSTLLLAAFSLSAIADDFDTSKPFGFCTVSSRTDASSTYNVTGGGCYTYPIPDDFTGNMLDVPVGTAVFTAAKYKQMTKADITCLDYSTDMLERAEQRLRDAGITNVKTMQGNVGALPFENDTFDFVLCMNGLHVFPDKEKAYAEILRTLKPGGELLACFYIAGEQKVADWLAKTVMTRMGWFTPPFDTAADVRSRLQPYYDIIDFHIEGAMLYFRARKK